MDTGLLGRIDDSAWQALFGVDEPAVLGRGNGLTLEALRKAAFEEGKKVLRVAARDRIEQTGAQVVVMGHTHQPDKQAVAGGRYFNPGCWTRYLELAPGECVTLEDLKDESRYPYELNYVRVAPLADGRLESAKVCFERG